MAKKPPRRRREVHFPTPPGEGGKPLAPLDLDAALRRSILSDAFSPPPLAGGPTVETFDRQVAEREELLFKEALLSEKHELGLLSFWYFVTNILFPKVWQQHYHEVFHHDICEEIQSLERGEDFWGFLPREFRKSYLLHMAFAVWRICKDPNIRILAVGAREATVKPFAMLIRDMFVEGTPGMETFHEVFPEMVIPQGDKRLRQSLQFTHPRRTANLPDPTYRATYLGVSGAGWRCDLLIVDDPIERRNVNTVEQSAKALRNLLDLLPLIFTGSPYRNVIGMMTRWAYHDPGGYIIGDTGEAEKDERLAELHAHKRRIMIRHALEHPTRRCTTCPESVMERYPHNDFDIAEGVPPDAPIHTREMILERLEEYRLDPDKGEALFYHQYGNICQAPGDQKFKKEWVIVAPFNNWPVVKRRAIAVDSADKDFQQEGRGDWMVALMCEYDDYGRMLLPWCIASNKWTRHAFLDRIIAWCLATGWWPNVFGKEKFGNDTFLTDVGKRFTSHSKPVHLKPIVRPQVGGNAMKKLDWITETLQLPLENAEVILGSQFPAHFRERLTLELDQLGQISHDDFADTLALLATSDLRPKYLFAQHGVGQEAYTPPPLALYASPGMATPTEAPGAGLSLIDAAIRQPRVAAGFTALPDINQRGPQEIPEGLVLKVDW